MSLLHLHKEPLHICIPSLISRLLAGMCGIFPWSKRYPDCPPTWLSWEQVSHDLKWDKLWMREDWLSWGRQSPSQFIWHCYLGNRAVRQEAEKRCKRCKFVWNTAKKLPGLKASRGYTVSLKILSIQWNAYLYIYLSICLSLYLLAYWSVCESMSLSVSTVYLSIHQEREQKKNPRIKAVNRN